MRFNKMPGMLAGTGLSPMVLVLVAAVVAMLAGCSDDKPVAEAIRPVKAITISAGNITNVSEFPGEIQARVESQLGFRIAGKIIERRVNAGTVVRQGQVLMRLDTQDLEIGQRQAESALRSARSNRDLAQAEVHRYKELRDKNFVNQATLDAKETAYQQAQSAYEQAQASLRNTANQTGYSELRADIDGVVTRVTAEVGQVVSAGTPVVSVAQSGDMDIVVGVPENMVDELRRAKDVRIRLWASPDKVMQGKVREVSPVADPATRTYTVKVALPRDATEARLGMTAYAAFVMPSNDAAVRLPLSALHQNKGQNAVWVVESGAVRLVNVDVSGHSGNEILVSGGISEGQVVVTAGANVLVAGQKVHVLGQEKVPAAPAATAAEGQAK